MQLNGYIRIAMNDYISQLNELLDTVKKLGPILPDIEVCGTLLLNTLFEGSKLMTCGNGGSAADALHLAEELLGRYNRDRKPLPAICLSADASTITCISNDFGYESVFQRQLEAYAQTGDLLVGFSTSGNSRNVIRAFETARELGVKTILLGGKSGGKLMSLADYAIIIPSDNTARIQEMHTFILHSWLEQIDNDPRFAN
jgi:D-sedoheptulose 7-phosphate isomerase